MNVIIANKYSAMLSNLNIDLMKTMNGSFGVQDIINTFDNFYYNKMILDITAIEDYKNISTIQTLSCGLDMSKVIFVLDDSEEVNSPKYLSQLVSMGIYNFTRNIDTITYLIDSPNTYKDVAQYQLLGEPNNIATTDRFVDNRVITKGIGTTRIIGIKNLTEHAGATSLTYMLKKQAEQQFKVLAIEIDKNDFLFFNDTELRSVSTQEANTIINNPNNMYDMILVDTNGSSLENEITEMLNLIEPSTIKLNKMVKRDRNILDKLSSKKIIINKSLLNDIDVADFENEARCKVFFNLPPLDDKKENHQVLDTMIRKLGFGEPLEDPNAKKSTKLFTIVKEN